MTTTNQPGGRAFPPGGNTGDVLTKASTDNQDIVWAAPGSIGASISATDGTTTVNPATSIQFPSGTLTNEGGGVAAVAVPVLQRTVTLTNAQIKALPTTAVELVPAPASGIAVPLMAFVTCDHAAGAYTNINATFSYITVVHGDDAIEPMTLITNSDGDGGNRVVSLFLSQLLALGDPGSVMLVNNGGSNINAPQGVTTSGHFYETELWAGALSLYAYNSGSGNFTGGNAANSLTVTVLYAVVE